MPRRSPRELSPEETTALGSPPLTEEQEDDAAKSASAVDSHNGSSSNTIDAENAVVTPRRNSTPDRSESLNNPANGNKESSESGEGVNANATFGEEAPSTPRLSATSHYKFGDITTLTDITKSPYENNESAEVGEHLFDRMKTLLLSQEELEGELHDFTGKPTLTCQEETISLFGQVLAESLVKAHHVIGKSGILFKSQWVDDKQCKIRDVQCGWISTPLMLLLLQEQRFARANQAMLVNLIHSLKVYSIFYEALKEFRLEKTCPRIMSSAPSLTFTSRKRECLKSVIFIARTYRCVKLLKIGLAPPHHKNNNNSGSGENKSINDKDSIVPPITQSMTPGQSFAETEPSLFKKIRQCLEICEENVKVNPKKLQDYEKAREAKRQKIAAKRRKQALVEAATQDNLRRQRLLQEQMSQKIKSANSISPATDKGGDAKPGPEKLTAETGSSESKEKEQSDRPSSTSGIISSTIDRRLSDPVDARADDGGEKPRKRKRSNPLPLNSKHPHQNRRRSSEILASNSHTLQNYNPNPALSPTTNGHHGPHTKAGMERQKSVEILLEMAEEQYKRLGQTIKILKRKIREDRNCIREEVRQELLLAQKKGSNGNSTNNGYAKKVASSPTAGDSEASGDTTVTTASSKNGNSASKK